MHQNGLTAPELRQDLTRRLELVVARYEVALAAVSELNTAVGQRSDSRRSAEASMPYRSDCIESVFARWLHDTVCRFEAGQQGVGQARIEVPFEKQHFDCVGCVSLEDMETAVRGLLGNYDFEGLASVLREAADGLAAKGLQEAAEVLVDEFALSERRWGTPPRRTGRHWVFSTRIYASSYGSGYDYNVLERLGKLKDAMRVAAVDAGLDGVGEAMERVVEQIWEHRGRGLPSRTRLGGGAVEGVIFKEKLELKLSPDAGDGLLAFLAMYADSKLRPLEAV